MSHLHVLASKSSIHPPEVICMSHTDVIGMQHHTPTSLGRHVCVDCVTILHTFVFATQRILINHGVLNLCLKPTRDPLRNPYHNYYSNIWVYCASTFHTGFKVS